MAASPDLHGRRARIAYTDNEMRPIFAGGPVIPMSAQRNETQQSDGATLGLGSGKRPTGGAAGPKGLGSSSIRSPQRRTWSAQWRRMRQQSGGTRRAI